MALSSDAKLQQRSFLMCIYASVTFILRAIDPKSYGHILPRAVSNLLSYTCTDALVTVMYAIAPRAAHAGATR